MRDETDEDGALLRTPTTWVTLKLNATLDGWSGTWVRRDVDPEGNVVLATDGTAEGRRLSVSPVPGG